MGYSDHDDLPLRDAIEHQIGVAKEDSPNVWASFDLLKRLRKLADAQDCLVNPFGKSSGRRRIVA
jgi:hypothetical protein